MSERSLRVRAFLDQQFLVVVVALVLLAGLGGWVTYTTHVDPGTTTEERPGPSWRTAAWFNHSATVTADNPVYPEGTTLRDRSIYFTEVTPVLSGEYVFTYEASESGDLDGTVSLELIQRGIEVGQENTTVVWQTSKDLETTSTESLAPGERMRVPFELDMNATANRTGQITERLGNPPGETQVLVRAVVDLQGSVNGQQVEDVRNHTLAVGLQGGTYRPTEMGSMTDRYESTQTVTVDRTYGPLRSFGGPALLLGSLVALGGLAYVRSQDRIELTPAERERLAFEDDRNDFDEWISEIQLPADAFDLPRAEAQSLSALVDFAIDTDNGVVEDPDEEAYYVVHDGYLYTYRPPAAPDGDQSGEESDATEAPEE